MEDLYKVLLGAEEPEARGMADRLEKFIRGSMAGIFDSQSSIKFDSKMTVFSTKNLEDVLRPIAFYIILDFVWTKIKKDLKKRMLIVEEAWYLMQNDDSARFIYGIAKRARKYYLGLTTISQDVDDFLGSEYGKAIVTNSSIQVLLKQHPAAIDRVAETFYLSEGEKRLLLAADKGEGLFFAGANHVAIKVKASEAEHKLVTTNPAELLKMRQDGLIKPTTVQNQNRPVYKPFERMDPNKYSTMDASGQPLPEFDSKINPGTNYNSQAAAQNSTQMQSSQQRPQAPQQPQRSQQVPMPQTTVQQAAQYQSVPQSQPRPVEPVSVQQPRPQTSVQPVQPMQSQVMPQPQPRPQIQQPVQQNQQPMQPRPEAPQVVQNQAPAQQPRPQQQPPVQQPTPNYNPSAQNNQGAQSISSNVVKPMSETSTIQPNNPMKPINPVGSGDIKL
jgi:hypothetical protein